MKAQESILSEASGTGHDLLQKHVRKNDLEKTPLYSESGHNWFTEKMEVQIELWFRASVLNPVLFHTSINNVDNELEYRYEMKPKSLQLYKAEDSNSKLSSQIEEIIKKIKGL